MFYAFIKDVKTALLLFLFLTLLTGVIYPLMMTGFAQVFFPNKANGSLVRLTDKNIGSLLIGQSFTDGRFFWGRPSKTSPYPYNGAQSNGSNFGPLNPDLIPFINQRILALQKLDPAQKTSIPIDLVTTSASGLDPEISLLAALYQVSRIAKMRHVSEKSILQLVYKLQIKPTIGILGEARINVLQLNMALLQLRTNDGRASS